jgi:hypothetical protein
MVLLRRIQVFPVRPSLQVCSAMRQMICYLNEMYVTLDLVCVGGWVGVHRMLIVESLVCVCGCVCVYIYIYTHKHILGDWIIQDVFLCVHVHVTTHMYNSYIHIYNMYIYTRPGWHYHITRLLQ